MPREDADIQPAHSLLRVRLIAAIRTPKLYISLPTLSILVLA